MTHAPCLATDMAAHIILWQGTFMGSWPCLAAVIFIDDCTALGFYPHPYQLHPNLNTLTLSGVAVGPKGTGGEWTSSGYLNIFTIFPAFALLDKLVYLWCLFPQAPFITHMHMCLPLTLSSADLCKGP